MLFIQKECRYFTSYDTQEFRIYKSWVNTDDQCQCYSSPLPFHTLILKLSERPRGPFTRWCHPVKLTHLPLELHICVRELDSTDSTNSLLPIWCQAITWTSAGVLSIGSWEQMLVKFESENSIIFIQEIAFEIVFCQNGDHLVKGEMGWIVLAICGKTYWGRSRDINMCLSLSFKAYSNKKMRCISFTYFSGNHKSTDITSSVLSIKSWDHTEWAQCRWVWKKNIHKEGKLPW